MRRQDKLKNIMEANITLLNEFKYGFSLGQDGSLPNKKEREIGGNDNKKKYIISALDSISPEDLQKVYVLVVNGDKRGTDGITY